MQAGTHRMSIDVQARPSAHLQLPLHQYPRFGQHVQQACATESGVSRLLRGDSSGLARQAAHLQISSRTVS